MPTTAVVIQETLPTGKFDRLGDRPADGLGGGTYATTLGFYTQTYLWLPNGRILRTRLDVSRTLPGSADVDDASVYGTAQGFRGRAKPGKSLSIDSSWEYSMTRSWVLALDITYRHGENTQISGRNMFDTAANPSPIRIDSGSSSAFGFAPAIEYSWNESVGVIFGIRVIPHHQDAPASVTPAVAINYVH